MPEQDDLVRSLQRGGVHEALRFLNSRTPHRFTGVYRYDGDILRNEFLFDRDTPDSRSGADVAMEDAYCAIVGQEQKPLEFADVRSDGRIAVKPGSAVTSYCGVLIRTEEGEPFGTLCHFDFLPCQQRISDIPLLEVAAPLIFGALRTARSRDHVRLA